MWLSIVIFIGCTQFIQYNLGLSILFTYIFILFSDPDNDVTLAHYLEKDKVDPEALAQVIEQLDIKHLMSLSFVKLSNGQTRRARIARALLQKPVMLILDEPLSKPFPIIYTYMQAYRNT